MVSIAHVNHDRTFCRPPHLRSQSRKNDNSVTKHKTELSNWLGTDGELFCGFPSSNSPMMNN
ncbi:hypothetical protein K443DRAFT_628708 [Laccaria amethystina LaAM-08-1]|uniref:Uncharacterized protein n=1 Tax=Laccaria amethystina LaAM-08-1 TaxID=1095629 RepID=A0A0C9X9R2_9AGAR|nr:hypothetical protein K443DRAFT_628708 [Laccaria amethystina LaAM-08-1]